MVLANPRHDEFLSQALCVCKLSTCTSLEYSFVTHLMQSTIAAHLRDLRAHIMDITSSLLQL